MSYDLYRTSSIYESSANTVNINPSLAEEGFYPRRPALIHGIPEKPFEIPDERDVYSPNKQSNGPEEEIVGTPIDVPFSERTNPELAALVAKIIEQEKMQAQTIEKIVIQAPVTQKIGEKSLLLAAASSL